jgi:potassium-transporting ATPase potassium-binding subunit
VLLSVMAVLWIVPLTIGVIAESNGNRTLPADVSQAIGDDQVGGNLEGKDIRFGAGGSALLTLGSMGTTAGIASSGIGSYTPVGQSGALVPILLGEVAPGGVGGGLVGMLTNVLLATFIAGLLTGRTPSYLGVTIGRAHTTLIMLTLLVVPFVVLVVAASPLPCRPSVPPRVRPGRRGSPRSLTPRHRRPTGTGRQ